MLINSGRSNRPDIVAFHHRNYTAEAEWVHLGHGNKKKIHLFPALDPYFMAVSLKGIQFIKLMLQQYYELLEMG